MNGLVLIKKPNPIADFHCDLLCYLHHDPRRSAHDRAPRCGIPQLKEGNVKIQIMPIFTETEPGSSKKGLAQAEIFKNLPTVYSDYFEIIRTAEALQSVENSSRIGIMPAFENASSLCDETENLEQALKRLKSLQKKMGKIAYVSLTWNTENRFGGGALTHVGLKEDGKRLIDELNKQHIPLDLSHASDRLAYDALEYIDKHTLTLPLVASHSNFRSIVNVPRNLPDDLAREILKRGGVIGLNFIRHFVGAESESYFLKQLEHALRFDMSCGLCFGADFFFEEDISPLYRKSPNQLYFSRYNHAGTYERVVSLWRNASIITEQAIENICFRNLQNFLIKVICNN
jgi:microsomal dipeptidase-like Zn-dependent dipeptidase